MRTATSVIHGRCTHSAVLVSQVHEIYNIRRRFYRYAVCIWYIDSILRTVTNFYRVQKLRKQKKKDLIEQNAVNYYKYKKVHVVKDIFCCHHLVKGDP